jgi:hypothetical protein
LSSNRYLKPLPFATIIGVSIASLGFLACALSVANATVLTVSHTSCTVTKKEAVASTKGQTDLLIHAEGCDGNPENKIFSMANNHEVGNPHHEITFEEMEAGRIYTFETRGHQILPRGSHETIIKITTK